MPCIWVLAGTNGAGKSSVAGAILRRSGGDYFNPDEVAQRLRSADPLLTQRQANAAAWAAGLAKKPDWLRTFTPTGEQWSVLIRDADGALTETVGYDVFSRSYAAGAVSLGAVWPYSSAARPWRSSPRPTSG